MKHIKKPCAPCPWRKDAEPGRFTEERWTVLEGSVRKPDEHGRPSGPEYGDVLFACHITQEGQDQLCAGWLAVEGAEHPNVRLDVFRGVIPQCALSPQEGWPELHDSFDATRDHDLMED